MRTPYTCQGTVEFLASLVKVRWLLSTQQSADLTLECSLFYFVATQQSPNDRKVVVFDLL